MSIRKFFTDVSYKWSYAKIREAEDVNFNLDTMPEKEWKRFAKLSRDLQVIITDLYPTQFTPEEVDIFATIEPWKSDSDDIVLTEQQQVVFDKFRRAWEQDLKEHNERLMEILLRVKKD